MHRAARELLAVLFLSTSVAGGCGGGSTATSPPPPPPPQSNPTPQVSSVSPVSATAGASDTTITVAGSGFISSSTVDWNGSALATSFVSATQLKATVPAADLTGSATAAISVATPAPGGGTSPTLSFAVNSPAPAITGISPRYVPPGGAATITITGSGFESNSVAQWNGSARPTMFVSSTTLSVALSATDLQNQGTGSLTVSNPAPAASASGGAMLTVTSQPVPVIQSASVTTGSGLAGNCPVLQVTLTGQNFGLSTTVQANGASIGASINLNPTTVLAYFPAGFVAAPGALSFTLTNLGAVSVTSDPFAYPTASPPVLTLCASPSPATVYAASSFSINVQPSEVNVGGNGTLTLGTLPAGITWSNGSIGLPPSGVTIHLQAASSTAAGTYDIALNGSAGTASAKGDFNFTVSTGTPPDFFFATPVQNEVGVPIGGSGSIQYQSVVNSSANVDYDVTPSVGTLPTGTTATFTPSVFPVGQSVQVTLTAANNAPVTQNALVTLTGTPSSTTVSSASASFYADVTQPPGSLPGNRTDFVSTAGTPYAAVFDAKHNLIFSSNPYWNRVDVISNATHKIVKSVPVRSPRGIDITQDNAHVWVQTASPNIYEVDTTTFQAQQYKLPTAPIHGYGGAVLSNLSDRLLALSDGTVFLYFDDGSTVQVSVWNPGSNKQTALASVYVPGFGVPIRSGDGTRVYASNRDPSGALTIVVYSVSTQSLSTISGIPSSDVLAVNQDGSRLVLLGVSGSMKLCDNNLNLLGTLPGVLPGLGYPPLDGGVVFGADGSKLYALGLYDNVAVILTVDATSMAVLGLAPTSFSNETFGTGNDASATPSPFAIDTTGLVLTIQKYGISFEDSTFFQNYIANEPTTSGDSAPATPASGPLSGGTTSSLYAFPALQPDVWFGQTRGSTSLSQGELQFTSPPSQTPGPVNVKFIYPDGQQAFYPQLFGYSTVPEYALTSGSSPNGGATGQVVGYGLPQDPSQGTVAVGGNTATITTMFGQYPPQSTEPYPSTVLNYTFPTGSPGYSDLTVSTPIGSGTLPKAILYAKSVNDYSSSDSFNAVIFDAKRKQVYLSAGDHVDVFQLGSGRFAAPLQPAANGSNKEFTGLALTPDGSELLVADLLDGSLAVINPDSPSSTFAIPIAPAFVNSANNCEVGPLYVAATSTNQAFVSYGSLLTTVGCQVIGNVYLANLQTHGVTQATQCNMAGSLDASSDGNWVALGGEFCLYSAQSATYVSNNISTEGLAISGDGNITASGLVFTDGSLNILGSVGYPVVYYGDQPDLFYPIGLLLYSRLNASGSLYFSSYANYFEVVDVERAMLRLRFGLTETIQNAIMPMAIDSGGRYIFLITDKGLTVVDLGQALLSVGHLSQQNVSAGAQITVRGSGFDANTTATVGGVAATVTFTDENTLTLTIPAAASGPEDLVLTRGDGQTYTLENAVVLP